MDVAGMEPCAGAADSEGAKLPPPPPSVAADASACPRPAAPFALSMLAAAAGGGSNCEKKFELPSVVLRKVAPQPIFASFDDSAYLIKPPTQMMRFLDALRYHKPTDAERCELNISSSAERLHLHHLNDILVVCGARKGFRFNSQDINALRTLSEQLATQFELVDQMFRALPLEVTRYKFPATLRRIEDDPQFFRHASMQCVSELSPELSEDGEAALRWRALAFQWHARQYIESFARLRETVLSVRERLDHYFSTRKLLLLETKDLGDAEAEFEAKVHHPLPTFLFVLIQKYHRECREEEMQWTTASTEPPVDSIAQFALFIAGVLVHRAPLTVREMRSMEVMLQVLKVTYRVDYELLTLEVLGVWRGSYTDANEPSGAHITTGSHGDGNGGGAVTHSALSSLLYDFLSTVRELRLVPRQKELLQPQKRSRRARRRSTSMRGGTDGVSLPH